MFLFFIFSHFTSFSPPYSYYTIRWFKYHFYFVFTLYLLCKLVRNIYKL
nr:MAG TPA: hypothetical protein [Caudoviricetes sp.]